MSTDLLEYGLRVSIIWFLLLSYYFIWGRKTGFRFQRIMLLGGWILGLVIPLLPALKSAQALPVVAIPSISLTKVVTTPLVEVVTTEATWQWVDLLPWVYLFGVLLFGARALVQSWWIRQCLANGKQSSYAGFPVITSGRIKSPFAAQGYIFMPEGLDPALTHTALLHETAHLRARHHYDKTLMTIGSILLWFHPLMWAYRRLLATIHEYEADAAVVQTVPVRTYGLQLLHCSLGPTGSLGLFSSPLKQRIEMITTKQPSANWRLLPMLTLGILLAGLTFACSDLGQSSATPAEEPLTETVEGPVLAPDQAGGLYRDLETLQASMEGYIKDVYQEIRYPAAARSTGTIGKFRAKLTVGEDGKIETIDISPFAGETVGGPPAAPEITIVGYAESNISGKQVPEVLTEEINRTIAALDNFQPYYYRGKPAKRSMNIDFNFKLE